MVRQQPDGMQPQVAQNLRADAVLVLQLPLPGLTLVVHELAAVRHQARFAPRLPLDAEARTGFVQVNQHAAALLRDRPQRIAHQPAALAVVRSEHVAVQAPRMHAHQHAAPVPRGRRGPAPGGTPGFRSLV